MKYLLKVLLTPTCWTRNRKTNKVFNAWMKEALKNPEFEEVDDYEVKLNGTTIWIKKLPIRLCYLQRQLPVKNNSV